jgi:hypothetical protein
VVGLDLTHLPELLFGSVLFRAIPLEHWVR